MTSTMDMPVTTGEEFSSEDPLGGTPAGAQRVAKIASILLVIALIAFWAVLEPKIWRTVLTVTIAVVATAGLWVLANLLFDQVRNRWVRFSALAFGAVGALFGIFLHGNHVTVGSGDGFLTWIVGPLVGALAFGGFGVAMALNDDPQRRRVIAIGASAAIGIGIGAIIREEYWPGLDPVAIAVYTVALAALGAGLSLLRKRPPLGGALTGAALGWVLGAWGGADLGDGSIVTSIVACLVPGLLIGVRLAMTRNPDYAARAKIDERSRAVIFIGPALVFIGIMLVIPAIRTIYLSLLDRRSEEFVGLDNYQAIFSSPQSWNTANWTNMFTSIPFIIGAIILLVAVAVGIRSKQQTGRFVELGNPTMAPLVFGFFILSFGVFTALRGTIVNNLWWVVVVTFLSTSIGLAVAVLADGRHGERVAKSIIFMPMAISLVGASIIWRFMYRAQDPGKDQTGVMNALWVGLGRLSTGSGLPTLIATIALGLLLLACMVLLANALVKRQWGRAVIPAIAVILVGWFFIRFVGLFGTVGIGGFEVKANGDIVPKTILFVQEPPYNNFWLMLILIWIQTGFAMVILSAAIKAVPTELIEAAKIDGATNSQVFWRVTLPQIATTIGVVVTTLIVLVMKVFDIVKVVTNGQFGTQVLANNMFDEAFNRRNTGLGAALAILIFISVLPVMYVNVRRMQREN